MATFQVSRGRILKIPAMAIKPSRWQDGCKNRLVILELVHIKQDKKGEIKDVATFQHSEVSTYTKL